MRRQPERYGWTKRQKEITKTMSDIFSVYGATCAIPLHVPLHKQKKPKHCLTLRQRHDTQTNTDKMLLQHVFVGERQELSVSDSKD
jgi:hypothetical protein